MGQDGVPGAGPGGADHLLCAPGWRRGCAQVGIIRALAECGIPVDMVGGTSIGAFMGALYSEERSYSQMRIRAKQWAEVRAWAPGAVGAGGPWDHWPERVGSTKGVTTPRWGLALLGAWS